MKRVPFIPQMEAAECGAACLTMVLAYHGHHAPLAEIREACGVSRDGSTAKGISEAAAEHGLRAKVQRLEPADLARFADKPMIIHWEMNHFVVLEKWTSDRVRLVDPAMGPRDVAAVDFDKSFTGIAIELTPATRFKTRAPERLAITRALSLLRGAGSALSITLVTSLFLDVLAIVMPVATQIVVDQVLLGRQSGWLTWIMLSALAAIGATTAFTLIRGALLLQVKQALDARMTTELVRQLLQLPLAFFLTRYAADLVARVRTTKVLRDLVAGQAVTTLVDGVMLLAYLAMMMLFDARLGAVVVVAGVLYVALYLVARPYQRKRFQDRELRELREQTRLVQTLQGIVTVKGAGAEAASHTRWLSLFLQTLNATVREVALQDIVGTVLVLLRAVVPVLVLWIGGGRVLTGQMTPGTLVTFQMLQAGFLLPLEALLETLLRLQVVPVLLGRMDDVLLAAPERQRGESCPTLGGSVELDKVSFQYGSRAPLVLDEVSLKIKRGEKVAFVGPSGCGKSTIARLLMGLFTPTSGKILVDGRDIAELDLTEVRRQFGVVLQETSLFDGTIRENIALFYGNAPFEEIVNAAQVAQIHDDIQALPHGYETRISDALCPLSGGQRQRLALARAILHRPPIMILDEATSALDSATEAAIERYLSTRSCTRIVIAHRLSTVRDADRIFVMYEGKIIEEGRHAQLLELGRGYAQLVALGERSAPVEAEVVASAPAPSIGAGDLEAFALCASWTEAERAELAASLVRIDAGAGDHFVTQDKRGGGLFLIEKGTVAIQIDEPGLPPWTVVELGPGQLFGEISLLDGSPNSASAIAAEPTRVLCLRTDTFQELRGRHDALALRLTLALGALVSQRVRGVYASTRALVAETDASSPQSLQRDSIPMASRPDRGRVLGLGETALGSTLTAPEVAALEARGEIWSVKSGDVLFTEGERSDHVLVVLAGRLSLTRAELSTEMIDAGAAVGRLAAFDAEPQSGTCTAVGAATVFALRREVLHALVRDGNRGAAKVLAHLTQNVVGALRIANYRLREALARSKGEVEEIRRAQALYGSTDPQLTDYAIDDGGAVPLLKQSDPSLALATCAAAVLAYWGRAVPIASVVEACVRDGAMTAESLGRGVRSFGMTLRPVHLTDDDLAFLDNPLVLARKDVTNGAFVVAERAGASSIRIMDPAAGARRVIPRASFHDELTGSGFEIVQDHSAGEVSPGRRLGAVLAAHKGEVAQIGAATLLLELGRIGVAAALGFVVGEVLPHRARDLLHLVAAAVLVVTVSQVVLAYVQATLVRNLRTHVDRHLVDQLMGHVLKLPLSFFEKHEPGETWQRFQSFQVVRDLLSNSGVSAVLGIGSLLMSAIVLGAVDGRLLVPIVIAVLVHVVAAFYTSPRLRHLADEETTIGAEQQGKLLELLGGVATIRMAGDAGVGLRMWLPGFRKELGIALGQERTLLWFVSLLDLTRQLAIVAVLWIGARAVIANETSTAAFLTGVGVAGSLLGAVQALTFETLAIARGLVHVRRVRDLFHEKHEQEPDAVRPPGKLRGQITLENVSFRYSDDGPLAASDVSLEIPIGAKVALVGASGSGKSTLGKLLLGFHLPTTGRILFDGKDLSHLDLGALRQQIGVVLQDTYLFGSTIRENLSLNAPGATLPELHDAARRAYVHGDIAEMPMGYDTVLAEGGKTLSGGQRQRLAIARALVHRPAILMLDEATSALDNLSQAAVEQNLGALACTRIVIAHRLSSIVDADLIVMVHRGAVVETGTHAELIAKKGRYHALVESQLAS